LPPEDRAKVDAYSIKRFAPVLARVGFAPKKGEDPATGRLRVAVLGLLAKAQDPKVVKELTRLGRAYAGTDAFRPEVVAPDLAGLALGVAVEHGDGAFMDLLLARLAKTEDSELRERILNALGEAKDAKGSARALAVTLDPALRKQEGMIELFAQAGDPRTREASWAFLKEHYDTIVAKIPKTYAAYLPFAASAFCDAAHADDAQAFFGPRADKVDGMGKPVRQVTEGVRLCAAQAAAQRESAQAFFSGKPAKVKQAPAR
jgi:alanyl aminopeptidase